MISTTELRQALRSLLNCIGTDQIDEAIEHAESVLTTPLTAPPSQPVDAPKRSYHEAFPGERPKETDAEIHAGAIKPVDAEEAFEDVVMDALLKANLTNAQWVAMTFKRWKDSIDVEYPTVGAMKFAEQIVEWMQRTHSTSTTQQAVPDGLIEIGRLLATQDNRITDQPIFAVQQKRRIYGIDPDYGGEVVWVNSDGNEADEKEFKELEEMFKADDDTDNWTRTSFHDEWEFVTACFTEQGCKDYLAKNGHNLKEPRIYAYGSYRNDEYQTVRKWLMSLAAAPSQESRAKGQPPQDQDSRDGGNNETPDGRCIECGHGNRFNGRIVHAPNCKIRYPSTKTVKS